MLLIFSEAFVMMDAWRLFLSWLTARLVKKRTRESVSRRVMPVFVFVFGWFGFSLTRTCNVRSLVGVRVLPFGVMMLPFGVTMLQVSYLAVLQSI